LTGSMSGPSDAAILERAVSLAHEAALTVALQRRRLRSDEPEDEVFPGRWWVDAQFLIVALRRLRRAAELAQKVAAAERAVKTAVSDFDLALPGIREMRNVGEHIDSYAVDDPNGHHSVVRRQELQVGSWDGTTYSWLNHELDVDVAEAAALDLYEALRRELDVFATR